MQTQFSYKVSNRQLQDSNAHYQCQKKLLNEEINIKQSKIRVLSNEVTEISAHLSTLVSSIDFLHLRSVCDRENAWLFIKLKHHETIQEKKLFRLPKDVSKSSTPDPDKVILNYSSRQLTEYK